MTGREWKPGDVAMVAGEVVIRVAYSGGREDHAFIDGLGRHWRHEDDTAHPLVVIDPEDREAVERLGDLFGDEREKNGGQSRLVVGGWADAMQAALREFANPNPPKPEEPTGLGAVVEDSEGFDWHLSRDGKWLRLGPVRPEWRHWSAIDAVRVLSEGVQP